MSPSCWPQEISRRTSTFDASSGTVSRARWSPNAIELDVLADPAGNALINQNFHPGWRSDAARVRSHEAIRRLISSPAPRRVALRIEATLGARRRRHHDRRPPGDRGAARVWPQGPLRPGTSAAAAGAVAVRRCRCAGPCSARSSTPGPPRPVPLARLLRRSPAAKRSWRHACLATPPRSRRPSGKESSSKKSADSRRYGAGVGRAEPRRARLAHDPRGTARRRDRRLDRDRRPEAPRRPRAHLGGWPFQRRASRCDLARHRPLRPSVAPARTMIEIWVGIWLQDAGRWLPVLATGNGRAQDGRLLVASIQPPP